MLSRCLVVAALCLSVLHVGCGTRYSASFRDASDASRDVDVRDATPSRDVQNPPWNVSDVSESPPSDAADVRHGHGPPYPLILHHGFAGFRDFGGINYFYNVARDLRARGEVVYETEVSPFLPPQQRGYELARFVDRVLKETNSEKVVIIGHSQGGLDARFMISSLGYGDRVALLATIATPHRGSRVADAIVDNVPGVTDAFLNAVATVFGYAFNEVRTRAELRRAAEALSERAAVEFNRQNPDDPRVVYWSWAGRTNRRRGDMQCAGARIPNDPSRVDEPFVALAPFAVFLEQGDPELHVNDGLVEVASARWGIWMGCVPADHYDEVGQIAHSGPNPESGFDHLEFYRDIVRRIHAAGF